MNNIPDNVFSPMDEHDFFHDHGSDDLHSTQITKAIVDNYLDVQLYIYGQYYTESVLKVTH